MRRLSLFAMGIALIALAAACGQEALRVTVTPSPSATAAATHDEPCNSTDLSASATLSPTGQGVLVGRIEFVNRSQEACLVEGYPEVQLSGRDGPLEYISVKRNVLPVQPVLLQPGRTGYSGFQFTEWCLAENTALPLSFVVKLPSGRGELRVVIAGGDLSERLEAPACGGISPSSTLHVGPFESEAQFPKEDP